MKTVTNRVLPSQGTHEQLEKILEIVKKQLKLILRENLTNLILFGSQARKEARLESDIDVLVILKNKTIAGDKHERIIDLIANLSIEYGVLVSLIYINERQWKTEKSPLLLNVRKEGITL